MDNPNNNEQYSEFLSKRKQGEIFFRKLVGNIVQGVKNAAEEVTEHIDRLTDQNQDTPSVLTLKEVVSFALELQHEYPEIVSTRLCYFEDKGGKKVFAQTMINGEGESVFADSEKSQLVGRLFPETMTVSPEIKELFTGQVECIFQLPQNEITFTEVLEWGLAEQKKNPKISAVQFRLLQNNQGYVLTALDSTEKGVYSDTETIIQKTFPANAKIDERLKMLLDGNSAIIPLE